MAILMEKRAVNTLDSRQLAGIKQEEDVAFYLRRVFKERDDFLIFHDYQFSHAGEQAQIDHLVIHPYGFLILESKSIYGQVKVNPNGEWMRSYNGNWIGIPSPIKQAEMQMSLLKNMISANVEDLLGKFLGVQERVGGRQWDAYCVVSNSCIIHREHIEESINKRIVKSESVALAVLELGESKGFMSRIVQTRPWFSAKDMQSIARFLLEKSTRTALPECPAVEPVETAEVEEVSPQREPIQSQSDRQVGMACKACNETSALSGEYGKYGYYVRCHKCNTNTSMRINCPKCGAKGSKIMKRQNQYFLVCDCSVSVCIFTDRFVQS